MVKTDEWIEGNLMTIRAYLNSKFPGYTVTEHAFPNHYHQFTVTNRELQRKYGLKVDWSRLSDRKNTPQRLWSSLISGFVASAMVRAGEEGLTF